MWNTATATPGAPNHRLAVCPPQFPQLLPPPTCAATVAAPGARLSRSVCHPAAPAVPPTSSPQRVRDATRHEIQALRRENDEPKQLVAVVRCQGELIAGPARIAGLPAGDTVEVVRIVDGRGKGQSGGLFVRATARFAEAYRLAQDSRAWELLPSSRLFLPDGSTREGKTVTLTPPRDACID